MRINKDFRAERVSVRELTAEDWPLLRQLRLLALEESPTTFLGDLVVESGFTEKVWQAKLRLDPWVAAFDGQTPIGLARLNCNTEPGEDMHIEAMWVRPQYRRRGIGGELMSALETIASRRGADRVSLWVVVDNRAAKEFYLNLGYRGPIRQQPLKIGDRSEFEEEYNKRLR